MKLDKIRFARFVNYISPMLKYKLCDNDLIEIDNILDVDTPQPEVAYPSVSDINMLMHLMATGTQKIEAIKAHRKLTGWGLKESEDQVEKYWVSKPAANDTYVAPYRATLDDVPKSYFGSKPGV